MRSSRVSLAIYTVVVLATGFGAGIAVARATPVHAQAAAANRVFELRTYTAPEGKLDALHSRFRDHTLRIFAKHGMSNVVYLKPLDAPLSQNTLIYLLAHQSREAAKKSWADFVADPEWKKVAAESQVNGRIVEKVESVFAEPTEYSPMK